MSSFTDKVAELGEFASFLLNTLTNADRSVAASMLRSPNLRSCWSILLQYNAPAIRRFTLGFFYAPVPFQIMLDGSDFERMFKSVYPSVFGFRDVQSLLRASASVSNWCPILLDEAYYKMFPYKRVADSQHKLNVYFSEIIVSVKREYPIAYEYLNKHRALFFCSPRQYTADNVGDNRKNDDVDVVDEHSQKHRRIYSLPVCKNNDHHSVMSTLYNDQATAIVMYYVALAGNSRNPLYLLHALTCVYRPDLAKALSVMVKNSGFNGTRLGSKLCEAQTLTGRGVGECSLIDEARYRCDPRAVEESVWHCDLDALRRFIRIILEDELKDQVVEFEELEHFWARRWQWCVNGSHSAVLGTVDPRFKVRVPGVSQIHRRCVVEQLEHEPISSWNAESLFTGSLKLEHGKLRALFACDTLTYFAFEHLLRPIEQKWHGHRVLLDPGRGGMLGIARRIRKMQSRGSCNIMVDFEDFNSQHSIAAQQILFEELIALTGYDSTLGANIIKSFSHMNCYVEGKRVGHMYGTLCSGHRATTFINSVLNAAYIAVALGNYNGFESIHVGDDVYMTSTDVYSAAGVIEAIQLSGLRVNPMKQSVGVHTAEFLRMAVGSEAAYGYIARSLSSAISGNWLTLHKQSPREYLQTMVEHSWTLGNRCGDTNFPVLLCRSVARITRLRFKYIRALLLGHSALGNGPVRASNSNSIDVISVVEDRDRSGTFMSSPYYDLLSTLPHYASSDFLSKCTSELERETLASLGIGVLNSMVSTSYSKTLSSVQTDTNDYKVLKLSRRSLPIQRAGKLDALLHKRSLVDRANIGVLNRYPIITQIRNYLNEAQVRYLLAAIGNVDTTLRPIDEIAWGLQPHNLAIDGYLPYSDAVSYSAGVEYDYIRCDFPIYM